VEALYSAPPSASTFLLGSGTDLTDEIVQAISKLSSLEHVLETGMIQLRFALCRIFSFWLGLHVTLLDTQV
jgi:hypothetical protein